MKKQVIIIPAEVQELALQVPKDKQQEINEVLSVTFQKIADLEMDINEISVNSIADTAAMALAKEKRILVKNVRLEGVKLLKHKRSEVQNEMSVYTLQDKLLLKAIQILEIRSKSIEDIAEFKEKFLERYAAEQKLKRDLERLTKARKFHPDITIEEVEALSDELYEFFLNSLKSKYEAQQEEIKKAEAEQQEKDRQQQLHRDRMLSVKQYGQFFDFDTFLGGISEKEFAQFVADLRGKQEAFDKKQADILKENQRLAKEAEKARIEAKKKAEQEFKEREEERRKAREEFEEKKRLAAERLHIIKDVSMFFPDVNLANLSEQEFKALFEKAKSDKEKEIQLTSEREKIAKLQADLQKELQAKQEADKKARIEAEQKAEQERKKKLLAAKAPVKEQCKVWVNNMSIEIPENLKEVEVVKNIYAKFTSYKNWALTQIEQI